ncbi:MAG TPA: hypothetical protein VF112_04155 [Candidatus Dormibacteraeota bacterium]
MEQAQRNRLPRAAAWRRWEPLTGVAFIALFLAGVLMQNSPNPDESNAVWTSYFADRAHQAVVTISGFLLVASGLCLVAFLTTVWQRVAAARRPAMSNPLPVIAAGIAGAAIVVGGVAQAAVTGTIIFGSQPEPGVDVLRLSQDLGIPIIMVVGMSAAALSIAAVSIQAYSAGIFGRKLLTLGEVVAVGLLLSVFFFPMALLVIWTGVITTVLLRRGAEADEAAAVDERLSTQLSGAPARTPNGVATPAGR